jgi:hypothetical protein
MVCAIVSGAPVCRAAHHGTGSDERTLVDGQHDQPHERTDEQRV